MANPITPSGRPRYPNIYRDSGDILENAIRQDLERSMRENMGIPPPQPSDPLVPINSYPEIANDARDYETIIDVNNNTVSRVYSDRYAEESPTNIIDGSIAPSNVRIAPSHIREERTALFQRQEMEVKQKEDKELSEKKEQAQKKFNNPIMGLEI